MITEPSPVVKRLASGQCQSRILCYTNVVVFNRFAVLDGVVLMLKRISPAVIWKMGLLLFCLLLLGTPMLYGADSVQIRPVSLTLQYQIPLPDFPCNQVTAVDAVCCRTGMLVMQSALPGEDALSALAPHSYAMFNLAGKRCWQVSSAHAALLAHESVRVGHPAKSHTLIPVGGRALPDSSLSPYQCRQAISPDGHLLAEACIGPTSISVRRWRDGKTDGSIQVPWKPPYQHAQSEMQIQVTESGHIWVYESVRRSFSVELSPDRPMTVMSSGNQPAPRHYILKTIGGRVTMTPCDQQNNDMPKIGLGDWQRTLQERECLLTTTPDGRYALTINNYFKPATQPSLPRGVQHMQNLSTGPDLLLYDHPGHIRARLPVKSGNIWQGMTPTTLVHYPNLLYMVELHGIPYNIISASISPDGHHLGFVVTSTSDGQRSAVMYKW